MISRRDFLKASLGSVVLASVPAVLVDAFVSGQTDVLTFGDITVEYPSDGEWRVAINANGHSMAEVTELTRRLFIS